jgi:hypothetical protein
MATSARSAQVLMIAASVFTAMTIAGVLQAGTSARAIVQVTPIAVLGALSLFFALRIRAGGAWLLRGIIALEIGYLLLSVFRIWEGDLRGVGNLVLPGLILVLITRPTARRHFRGPKTYEDIVG